ncbi:hypothetical protein D9M68_549480 [compost metagenome]
MVATKGFVQLAEEFDITLAVDTDNDALRTHAVFHRRAFLEELGVGHDLHGQRAPLAGQHLVQAHLDSLGGAYGRGGLVDHHLGLGSKLGDGVGHREHVLHVRAAVLVWRCTNGDEDDFGKADAFGGIGREAQASGGEVAVEQSLQARFVDGRLTRVESGDTAFVYVDAAHGMTYFCQAGRLGQSNIAGSENSDLHAAPVCSCSLLRLAAWCSGSFPESANQARRQPSQANVKNVY